MVYTSSTRKGGEIQNGQESAKMHPGICEQCYESGAIDQSHALLQLIDNISLPTGVMHLRHRELNMHKIKKKSRQGFCRENNTKNALSRCNKMRMPFWVQKWERCTSLNQFQPSLNLVQIISQLFSGLSS